MTAVQSYLTVREQETSQIGPFVPFLVAFGVIGLVMSVLIVANVVSGAVVSGYRRIGILKSIGFTPRQVVAAYTAQVMVPALAGVLGGLVAGDLLAMMLLRQAANAYGVGQLSVPVWVLVAVPAAMLGLVAIAALLPALGAARLSAVQAIAAGRAPRAGRGYAAHRLLGRLRLPRPVTIGLAAPFARPARTAITLVAVLLGAAAVTFAIGLGSSLNRVVGGLSHSAAEPVQIYRNSPNSFQFSPAQQRTVQAALAAQPGTRRYVAETDNLIGVAGLTGQHPLTAFRGPAAWTGYPIISGHWYTGPGQAVVSTGFLTLTGKTVGGTVTIVLDGRPVPLRIVGEDFDAQDRGISVITDWRTLADAHLGPALTAPGQYDVGLRPGVSAASYAQSTGTRLGSSYSTSVNTRNSVVVSLMLGLIGSLTVLLALVAGLGVLNTVVLHTRDRVHDLGVLQGRRDDAPAGHRHGGLLGRRNRAGGRPDRAAGRDRAAPRGAAGDGLVREPGPARQLPVGVPGTGTGGAGPGGGGDRRGRGAAPGGLGGPDPHRLRAARRVVPRSGRPARGRLAGAGPRPEPGGPSRAAGGPGRAGRPVLAWSPGDSLSPPPRQEEGRPMATVSVRYIVNDVGEAIAFYCQHLGFTEVMHPAPAFAMLSRGDLRLVLSAPGAGPGGGQAMPDGTLPAPGGWNRFAIEVSDLDRLVESLRKQGARFRNEIVSGVGGRQILLEDPSGNPVELFEPTRAEARLSAPG